MQGLIGPLKELAEFEELCKNKKKIGRAHV